MPTLRSIGPDQLPALWLPFSLVNLGCLLQVSFQVLTDWDPRFFGLVGISGLLEWTGLALWAAHVAAVMLGVGRYGQDAAANRGPVPPRIERNHRVAALLAWHPELEPVFLEHGFDLIRNPVLRRTVARQVTLKKACRMKGVDLERITEALNRSRHPAGADACSATSSQITTLTPLTVERTSQHVGPSAFTPPIVKLPES